MHFGLKMFLFAFLACAVILLVNYLIRHLATWRLKRKNKQPDVGFGLKIQLYQFLAHILILFPSYVFIFKDFYEAAAITVGVVIGINISLYRNYQAALMLNTKEKAENHVKEEQEAEKI